MVKSSLTLDDMTVNKKDIPGRKSPLHRRSKDHILTETQSKAFLEAAILPKDKVIAHLAVVMGMRESEIAHIRKEWLKEDMLCIPVSQLCSCGECLRLRNGIWTPKRPMSIRDLPMPPHIQELLGDYFRSYNALGVTRVTVYNRIMRLLQQIGVQDAYPHSLRATCATNLAANGMEAAPLCYFMGWAILAYAQHYIRIARARGEARKQIVKMYGTA